MQQAKEAENSFEVSAGSVSNLPRFLPHTKLLYMVEASSPPLFSFH